MTVLDFADRTAADRAAIATTQLHDDLWRVTRSGGEVLGYVERTETSGGDRFRAKRMLQRQRRFVSVGEFWAFADAAECFRV